MATSTSWPARRSGGQGPTRRLPADDDPDPGRHRRNRSAHPQRHVARADGARRLGRQLRGSARELPGVHRRRAQPPGLLRPRQPRRGVDPRRRAGKPIRDPIGAIDLGGKVVRDPTTGLILAGVPGCPRYNECEPVQYSEWEIWWHGLQDGAAPALNRLRTAAPSICWSPTPRRATSTTPRPGPSRLQGAARLPGDVAGPPVPPPRPHPPLRPLEAALPPLRATPTVINVFPYQLLELDVAGAVSERHGLTR